MQPGIVHDLLKSGISSFYTTHSERKTGSVRYTDIRITRVKGYFTHDINGGGDNMYLQLNICKMFEFLVENIFCRLEGVFSVR